MDGGQLSLGAWLAIFVPLAILALEVLFRFAVYVLLTAKAGKWWNGALANLHEENLRKAEAEQARRDERAESVKQYYAQFDLRALVLDLAIQLKRATDTLEAIRLEQEAQHHALATGTQISNLQIVWSWLWHRGDPNLKIAGGTTSGFMEGAPLGQDDVASGSSTREANDPMAEPRTAPLPPNIAGIPPAMSAAAAQAQPQVAVVIAPPSTAQVVGQLERLGALLDRGLLTPEEFAEQKAKLLSS